MNVRIRAFCRATVGLSTTSCSSRRSVYSLQKWSYKYKRKHYEKSNHNLAALTITFSTAFATATPEVIISTETVEVVTVETLDFFSAAEFDTATQNLAFTTTQNISVVQIFNAEGNMEFQLPVMSNNVQINKNLFGEGNYKLGFLLEGQTEVHFTQVTIK